MANIKLGSQAGWSDNYAQNLDSDYQLTPGDSGKLFFADATNAVVVNLPKLSADISGWNCQIILDVEGSSTISVVAHGLPAAGGTTGDAETVRYTEYARNGSASGAQSNTDGFVIETSAVLGHKVSIFTNGSQWFCQGFLGANSEGANIDTD